MARSLRDLIRSPELHKDLTRFLGREASYDPKHLRSTVISYAAFIDVGMERLLRSRMRKLPREDDNALFGANGVCIGFAAKVRLAYALGIIGPETKRDLLTINDIRNLFAHSARNITMSNKRLWQKTQTLTYVRAFSEPGGYAHETPAKRVSNLHRVSVLEEAMTETALELLWSKFPKKLLPPARGGKGGIWKGKSLRY